MASTTADARSYQAQSSGLVEVMERFMSVASRDIHTVMPAIVNEVDYDNCTVTVQPLIRLLRDYTTGLEYQEATVAEVPIIFSSAHRGAARLSMPVTEGDVGLLVYAERDTANFMNSDGATIVDSSVFEGVSFGGHLAKVGFFPEVFSLSAAREFKKDSVVLEYSKAISSWKASGLMTHKNDVSTLTLAADGGLSFTNDNCSLSLTDDGAITIDGASSINITCGSSTMSMASGGVVTINDVTIEGGKVSCTTMAASSSLTINDVEMKGHTHEAGDLVGYDNYNITGTTGEPVE